MAGGGEGIHMMITRAGEGDDHAVWAHWGVQWRGWGECAHWGVHWRGWE